MLHVGTVHNWVFTADDAALLQLAADRAALAVQSLRSREDHAAAVALQRSLVPSALLPVVRGAEIAALCKLDHKMQYFEQGEVMATGADRT